MDDPIEDINIADLAKEHAESQELDSKQSGQGLRKSLIAWERLRKRKREDEIWRRQVAKIWDKHENSKRK
jgi:hypothetical protein